ncbi:nuclear transport factor 2 family protein [Neorhizobium sp. T6_25]|uniref:nuclear transport factor 2 family protein n=1 Tax=Neorhizobium sp. T6_25 TaxID=2093833 RepID=UPI001FDEB95D|nr:nuclear transport factor 2 family protein [Neorhizobium sp. T6_25]
MTDHIATEEDRIRQTERARLSALVSGDVAAAQAHHAADFQLVTPIGAVLSRDQYLGAIASGHLKYLTWEPEEIAVRLYGPAAVIRYRARLAVVFGGHHVPLSGYWHTDSYEYRDDRWVAVWSQATAISHGSAE